MTNEELVEKIRAGKDIRQNLQRLYDQLKPFIYKTARKYKQDDEFEDLMQEGFLALYDAVEGYDPDAGKSFFGYAVFHIQGKIRRYVEEKGSCLRLPNNRREAIWKYKRFCSEFSREYGREPKAEETAGFLSLTLEQVNEIWKNAQVANLGSLDSTVVGLEGGEDAALGDFVADPNNSIEALEEQIHHEELSRVLWECVDELPGEQAAVIRTRYQGNMTVQATGECLGMTREQARKQEMKGLREIRKRDWNRLQVYLPETERIYNCALHGSLEGFNRTWTSSTERTALECLKNG